MPFDHEKLDVSAVALDFLVYGNPACPQACGASRRAMIT